MISTHMCLLINKNLKLFFTGTVPSLVHKRIWIQDPDPDPDPDPDARVLIFNLRIRIRFRNY